MGRRRRWVVGGKEGSGKRVLDFGPGPSLGTLREPGRDRRWDAVGQVTIPRPATLELEGAWLVPVKEFQRLEALAPDALSSFTTSNNDFGDVEVPLLARLTGLSNLDLVCTCVADQGLRLLAPLGDLESLRLGHTAVTDAGVPDLRSLPTLRALDLGWTAVSDASIPVLASLPSLTTLWTQGSEMTADGVRRLRALRPGVDVRHACALQPPRGPARWSAWIQYGMGREVSEARRAGKAAQAHAAEAEQAWGRLAIAGVLVGSSLEEATDLLAAAWDAGGRGAAAIQAAEEAAGRSKQLHQRQDRGERASIELDLWGRRSRWAWTHARAAARTAEWARDRLVGLLPPQS
jgi:hypothetical protein